MCETSNGCVPVAACDRVFRYDCVAHRWSGMVDFWQMLSSESRTRLDEFHKDQKRIETISDEEFGAKLIHYYHNSEYPKYGKGVPVYDSQMYWLLIPEMIRRIYKGNPPIKCPCPGCTCYWR